MEDRTLLATFVVTNTDDSGDGSLRWAILDSNATRDSGSNIIRFAIPGDGVHTIAFSSSPLVTSSVLIDGWSQPGYGGLPLINLDGQGQGGDGLRIVTSGVTVRGLAFSGFDPAGYSPAIHISGAGASDNWIYGNFIGTDWTGTLASPNGRGIVIDYGAHDNLIGTNADGVNDDAERNIISGNNDRGIFIGASYGADTSLDATRNTVAGNFIGLDITGKSALANGGAGISIIAAPSNTIGGTTSAARNVIAGNHRNGVEISGDYVYNGMLIDGYNGMLIAVGNVVAGNFIGTDVTGSTAVGNGGSGVYISSALGNVVGGTDPGAANLISGNGESGVYLSYATSNVVQGNLIGTDFSGTKPLGNSDGLTVWGGSDNTIGGLTASAGNRIAGNNRSGISLYGDQNRVAANTIGLENLGNGSDGVRVSSSNNTIGGTEPGAGNRITGNLGSGVVVTASGNRINGNLIFANGLDHGGLRFDGPGGQVQVPSFPLGGAMTVEAWVDAGNVHASWARVIAFGDGLGVNDIELGLWADTGQMVWSVKDPYGGLHWITTDAVFPGGRWVHVAATIDIQGNGAIYWNGQQVAAGPMIPVPQYIARSDWWSDSDFTGSLDQVKIWSAARTVEQIRQDMTTRPDESEPNLEAYYPLDEGQGLTVHDRSIHGRDATLANYTYSGYIPSWNSPQAIDLAADGVTYNAATPRQGPNSLQNSPVLVRGADGQPQGWLGGSLPSTPYHLEFFASAGYAPNGSGEAEVFLGALEVTTDGQGQAMFDAPFTAPEDKPIITATATDP
ncbi:MAG TPA: LamG-like jellyroll fold domain-containing protein, partial [Isosphaeraceae bacterium]|nr:LamG-like jellyroll fold domain-containing protein [Isosphaeraceae bacterium]